MRYYIKRDKLLEKKPFKSSDVTIKSFLSIVLPPLFSTQLVISLSLIVDECRNGFEQNEEITVGYIIIFVMLYATCISYFSEYTIYRSPQKYFRLCSFLAIFMIFPILFVAFYLSQTYPPGPETDKLLEKFKVSFYAAFIWIPVLTISLLLYSFVLWLASGIESYTVIMDGKDSSTKIVLDEV